MLVVLVVFVVLMVWIFHLYGCSMNVRKSKDEGETDFGLHAPLN